MQRRHARKLGWVILGTVLICGNQAEARRRRDNSYSYSNYAPHAVAATPGIPTLTATEADYSHAKKNGRETELSVRLRTSNRSLIDDIESLRAVVSLVDLSNTAEKKKLTLPVREEDKNGISFVVPDLATDKVYQLGITFSRVHTKEDSEEETLTPVGKVALDYYGITTRPDSMSRMRHRIATKAVSEWNDWLHGRTNKPYYGGGWCLAFYQWNLRGESRYSLSGTNMGSGALAAAALKEGVHGDMFYFGNPHYGMVLSYDKHTGQVWTVEGNFNNGVAILQRHVNSMSYGHLHAGMIPIETQLN